MVADKLKTSFWDSDQETSASSKDEHERLSTRNDSKDNPDLSDSDMSYSPPCSIPPDAEDSMSPYAAFTDRLYSLSSIDPDLAFCSTERPALKTPAPGVLSDKALPGAYWKWPIESDDIVNGKGGSLQKPSQDGSKSHPIQSNSHRHFMTGIQVNVIKETKLPHISWTQ